MNDVCSVMYSKRTGIYIIRTYNVRESSRVELASCKASQMMSWYSISLRLIVDYSSYSMSASIDICSSDEVSTEAASSMKQ